jgi:uncharacterized membrane protein YkvA (DUF1232 family)
MKSDSEKQTERLEQEKLKQFEDEITDEAAFGEKERYVQSGLNKKNTGPIHAIWQNVQVLWDYVKSGDVQWFEKVAPLAALAYLVSPIDLIPDTILGLGLLDDVGVIGFVVQDMWDKLQAFSNGSLQEVQDTSIITSIGKTLNDLGGTIKTSILESELTYSEVMRFFTAHKDDNEIIVKGAMLKTAAGDGKIVITQILLDKNNALVCNDQGIPLGRRLTVRSIDAELSNVFKNNDLVIVN